jgi:hypothetical protein
MPRKIKNYLLEWNLELDKGRIIIIYEDDSTERITINGSDYLKHNIFNSIVNVLKSNNPYLDNITNEIYNKLP